MEEESKRRIKEKLSVKKVQKNSSVMEDDNIEDLNETMDSILIVEEGNK